MYGVRGVFKTIEEAKAYYDGVRDGLRAYAWWLNGEQYLGTCGTRLVEAFDEVDEAEKNAIVGELRI